jgi:excisionase family DNA binding protein
MNDLLTVKELGALLGLGREATKAGIRNGELPGMKIGGLYRIRREWVEAYLLNPHTWNAPTPTPIFRTPGPISLKRKAS